MSTTQSVSEANKRRYQRLPLHLNVMLIQDGHRPRGCRVLNVSEGGMFLRWSRASTSDGGKNAAEQFRKNEKVEIRFSYRSPLGRKDISLPATVRRIEGEGIGVAFDEKDQAISELISSHLGGAEDANESPEQTYAQVTIDLSPDMEFPLTDGIAHNDENIIGNEDGGNLLSSLDADLDYAMGDYISSPPFDMSIPTNAEAKLDMPNVEQIEEELLARLPMPDYAKTRRLERRLLTVGLLTLFFGLAALISTGAYFYNTKTQIQELRTTLGKAAERIAATEVVLAPSSPDETVRNSLAELVVQMSQITQDLERIEQKVDEVPTVTVALPAVTEPLAPTAQLPASVPATPIVETPTIADEAQTKVPATAPVDAELTAQTALLSTLEQPAPTQNPLATNAEEANGWGISLIALRNKDAADRLAQKAETLGIPITVQNKGSDDKPLYQLKILGLASSDEAKIYAKEVEAKLGLSGSRVEQLD